MHEWVEDDFEGRYAVKLTVDTGDKSALMPLTYALEELAQGLDALGYRIEIDYLIAARPRKVIER